MSTSERARDRPGIALIGGGVRSGKSQFALSLARRRGQRRVFIATAVPFDAEMRVRIDAHVIERGSDFETLEAPIELIAALRGVSGAEVVVIDCLTLWLSNLLLRDQTPERALSAVDELSRVIEARRFHTVVVTNEVGMGVVPETPLGRAFRDLAGRAHQRLARNADEVYLAVLGIMLRIRPGPVTVEGDTHAAID
jgi:adenosylcobinamide kinase/adenosylcobinamide-phosphate guanylyltransferase